MTLALLLTAATGAWAAITTEDIGKVICTDGSLYATKILAQNDGKTAAAMIGYVDTENNKALAIALTDGNNNMDWTQACEYCTGLNTSLPVPNGTWVLPTEEQWNSVLTLEEVVPGYEVYKSESLNTKLNAAKGNALDNDGAPYWTCEETTAGGNYVKQISFNYGMASGGSAKKTATDGSMTRAFLEIELSAIEVTTEPTGETYFTEASFAMPAFDATVGFDIVRDMNDATYPVEFAGIPEPTTGGVSKIVVKKNSTSGKFEFLNDITIQLIDNISGTDVDIIEATGITIKVLKGTENSYGAIEYDQENPIKLSEFLENTEPGYYWIKAVPTDETTSPYIGTVYSYEMLLIKGYEVEVPADEFITYYKDENLTLEETENNAQLYTITSIGESTATATELSVAAANTPLLVKNNSNATKTILLIPTDDQADDVTAYVGFVGTLEATTIAASTNSQNNYAMNGKEFIWVRTAISVAANKAWLAVPVSSGNSANIRIVFDNDEATEIEGVDSGELTVDSDDAWYDLSGRKLDGQPTTKGVYIWKGKKVVVK